MPLTDTQFKALTALMGTRSPSKITGLRAVLVEGRTQSEASRLHGVSSANLNRAVREARDVIALCASVVANVEMSAPSMRTGVGAGGRFKARDALRGLEYVKSDG